jgi:hypothetical protein
MSINNGLRLCIDSFIREHDFCVALIFLKRDYLQLDIKDPPLFLR